MGKIRLSALISDGMVLQRDVENKIWGYANSGKLIRVFIGAYQVADEVREDGYFEVTLPKMQAGGPWKIMISDGEEVVTIRDILFGDVFLLGGQSNMELPIARTLERYEQEIMSTLEKEIRMFEVPKEYAFGEKREEVYQGHWRKAVGEDLLLFSAAGYFAAKELHEKEGVPIGLLQAAVGGTPVKAWCSEETIKKLGYDVAELEQCKQADFPRKIEVMEARRETEWWEKALSGKDGEKGTVNLPGFFEGTVLSDFYGAVILRRTIILPEDRDWEQEEGKLYLGAVIDADFTYINGVKVGETSYRYPPRIYPIPKGVLHAGANQIEVKRLVFRDGGGFMPGMTYELRYGAEKMESISLAGEWEYEIMRRMEVLPETTFFTYKAAGLYQGMLYPLRRWQLKGVFFYQGESNAERPETYEEEFTAMIADWRILWKQWELPFVYVQLAGFADGKLEKMGTSWAKMREAQRKAENNHHVKMVQAYDLGEYNELHPTDKKSVGIRIASAAEKLIYGKESVCQSSELCEVKYIKEAVEITFSPEDTTLHLRNGEKEVKGFAFVMADESRIDAKAELIGNAVVRVQIPKDLLKEQKMLAISYAWNDCPLDANLYNEAELPVVPFKYFFTDKIVL